MCESSLCAARRNTLLTPGPVLLYDGTCGLCTGLVQWVLRADPHGVLRFAPLRGVLAKQARLQHPEIDQTNSVVWLDQSSQSSRVFLRSEAVLRLWGYLGGGWRALGVVARWVPRSIRDWLYDQVASRRKQWFGEVDRCALTTPVQRQRLLE